VVRIPVEIVNVDWMAIFVAWPTACCRVRSDILHHRRDMEYRV
jgi:hypothetical protein